ncbi:hypothetical protein Sdiek1_0054 [Sulfurospirillum diekertiae]|uniref:Uncharacterized protein n=2 Tax=Sulfurospirillum diekertiae TaxID=1854492 RepID=A0A1Y0HGV5_9BACT|nr:hypothetical protein Sdiek1_0054 [Sulfurospirillum diekertiae]ASC92096.1 hypothetical protein Sdiek2_0053 [Sulfurospirillum diekertiae]
MLDCPICSWPLKAGKKMVYCYDDSCGFHITYAQEDLLRDISKKEVEDLLMGKTIEGLIHLDLDASNFIASKVTKLESYM